MVPHLAEECWSLTGSQSSLTVEPWPEVNKKYLESSEVIVVIQINGKRRGEVNVKKDCSEDEIYTQIKNIKNISDALRENISKSIYVKNKILNIVIK